MVDHGCDDGTNEESKMVANAVTSLLVTTRVAYTNFGLEMVRFKSGRPSDRVSQNVEETIWSNVEVEWKL